MKYRDFSNKYKRKIKKRIIITVRGAKLIMSVAPIYASISVLLKIIEASITPIQLWFTKITLDRVSENLIMDAGNRDLSSIMIPAGMIGVIFLIGRLIETLDNPINSILTSQLEHQMNVKLFMKVATFDIAFFESPSQLDKLEGARLQSGTAMRLISFTLNFIRSVTSSVLMLGIIYRLDVIAVLCLAFVVIPEFIVGKHFANKWITYVTNTSQKQRLLGYVSGLLLSREAIKEIKAYKLYDCLIHKYVTVKNEKLREEKNVHLDRAKTEVGIGSLSIIVVIGISLFAVYMAFLGRISIGDISLYIGAAQQSWWSLRNTFSIGGSIYQSSLFFDKIFEILDLHPRDVPCSVRVYSDDKPVPNAPVKLEFENVSFNYPGVERCVLKNISFSIDPGEVVAIVGRNGAGKTTLVKLIGRYYDPADGSIRLDGIPYYQFNPDKLRDHMSFIFQDFLKFEFSLRENVSWGNWEIDDDKTVISALQEAGADDVLDITSGNLDQMLGKRFDGGIDLSIGQWQKIALARSIYRDVPLMILDEPTASLDVFSEVEFYRNIKESFKNKTVIFISHRFTSVRSADKILVLDQGYLVESGNHQSLMKKGGLYAKMYVMQSAMYQKNNSP